MKTIKTINKVAGNYKPGDLVSISGRAGQGKTTYLIYEAVNAALNKNKVLFCVSDMSTEQVYNKTALCLKSMDIEGGGNSAYGMGVYNVNREKVDILIRQFPTDKMFIVRLSNFIKSLEKLGKKPDAIFIDSIEMMITPSMVNVGTAVKEMTIKLRKIAQETNTVIFIGQQTYSGFEPNVGGMDKILGSVENVDFAFKVEIKGKFEISKENMFDITLIKANGKEKNITLKTSFDFKNVKLKFLNFDYGYDDILYDLSNQFTGLSFVLSPQGEHRHSLLLNIAEMFSKTGKNVMVFTGMEREKLASIFEDVPIDLKETNLFSFEKNIGKKYFSEKEHTIEMFMQDINEKASKIKNLEYIIIDNIDDYYSFDNNELFNNFLIKIREFCTSENICIIAGTTTKPNLPKNVIDSYDFSGTIKKKFIADFILGLRKFTPGILDKLLRRDYNIILKILKNARSDYDGSFYAKIDDDKLNLKIFKTFSQK